MSNLEKLWPCGCHKIEKPTFVIIKSTHSSAKCLIHIIETYNQNKQLGGVYSPARKARIFASNSSSAAFKF